MNLFGLIKKFFMAKFACPCCGFLTYREKPNGSYEICPVCFWEDDPLQLEDENYEGGANQISLKQARNNYKIFNVCDERFVSNVRKPSADEIPDG